MAVPSNRPGPESTYAELAPRLQSIVAHNVHAPKPLIEDACQIAWSRWVTHRDQVSANSVLAWLSTTAIREALRQLRADSRFVPLEEEPEPGRNVVELPVRTPGPEQMAELREQLAEVRRLPVREQTALLMHGFGFHYREIAAQTGASRRTVERNLVRARRGLRLMASNGSR